MKQHLLLVLLPFLFMLTQCDKEEIQIRQLRIDLGSCQSDNNMAGPIVHFDFNKNDYRGLDSIIFMARLYTNYTRSTCQLDLYNLSDSVLIENSTLSSISDSPEWIKSNNLVDYFPDGSFDLTMKIQAEYPYYSAYCSDACLYLYMN